MSDPTRARWLPLLGLALALACASSAPPAEDATPPPRAAAAEEGGWDVVHEGFGVRARLPGWQVYTEAASAPAMVRPAFVNKKGPDDPPLLVAVRGDVVLTLIAQKGVPASDAIYAQFLDTIGQQGDVTSAVKLPESGAIVFTLRQSTGLIRAHSRAFAHIRDGLMLTAMLTRSGETPSEQALADVLRGIERRGAEGWEDPWELGVPIRGEPMPGYANAGEPPPPDPFEAVECAPGELPLLWTVPAAGEGTVYLFGSIHVGHPSFYPFAPPIERAFEESERLAVEADARPAMALQQQGQVASAGSLPPGEHLADVIPPELYARVEAAADELGMPVELFDGMSPGTAGILFSLAPMLARGFDPLAGVDVYFLERAGEREIVELEGQQQQLELISSFDEAFLVASLDGLDTLDSDLDALHRAWRCGDEEALGEIVFDRPRARAETDEDRAMLAKFNRSFFYERNRAMARRIEALAQEGGDSFVVVGVGHLVREQGIPALLEKAGYRVERIGP